MNFNACLPRTVAMIVALSMVLIRISDGADLVNGSFESALSGWTSGGNVTIESSPPYIPTDGSSLAAFNAVNSAPNGWISQQVDIQNSYGRYHRLRFDVGNLGYASVTMQLRVEVSEIGFGSPIPRINEVISIPGITGGATRWQQASYDFPSPVTGRIEIKLTDVTAGGNNADLVLDHLRIEDTVQLHVNAANGTYSPALPLIVSPTSIEGLSGGNTPSKFSYHSGTHVTLTAPAFSDTRPFLRWRKNGVDFSTSATTSITLGGDVSMVAIYDPPLILSLNGSPEARCFAITGPFPTLSWSGNLQNTTGAAEAWSATAVNAAGPESPVFFKIEPSHGILQDQEGITFRIVLTAAAAELPQGKYHGRVDIHSSFGTTSTSIVLSAISPEQHVENPGFESGFNGWTPLNHITRESQPPYTPTFGSSLVAFNSVNGTPDGVLTQTIPTETGATYFLDFDAGVLSYNTSEQRLKVELSDPVDPAAPPFFSQTVTRRGVADGQCHWQRHYSTFTAIGDFTTITFKDVSTTTSAIDLLLDNIVVRNPYFNFMVTTLADENDPSINMGSGDSLRELIAEAARRPGSHNIYFHSSLDNGTITLGGNELRTTTPLAINSWNSNITISGAGQSRVLNLGMDTTLRNLRIVNGNSNSSADSKSGGGIFSQGDLAIIGVTVSGNTSPGTGGGVFTQGGLLAAGSHISGNHSGLNGGGLHNYGTSYLESCSITENTAAGCGGGLTCQGAFASSWIILDRSSVTGNSAGCSGGGYSGISGYKQFGNLHALNSTFSGNHSGGAGGAIYGNGPVELRYCTISANNSLDPQPGAGGVTAEYPLIENSVIAANTPDLANLGNISVYGNFLGGNPMLGALGQHGGPTATMLPLSGSPLLDAAVAPPAQAATDQRGMPRVSGSTPDIGAVEIEQYLVNTLADENDGISVGAVSLRDAIAALASKPVELIRFAPTLNGGTIVMNGSITLIHPYPLSIDASNLPAGITLSGNHASPVFGLIFCSGLVLDSLTFRDSLGAIHADWCTIEMRRLKFLDNHNTGVGGAISAMSFDAYLTITDSIFAGNESDTDGGAIHNRGNMRIHNCTFSNNDAAGNGGGLWSGTYRGGSVELTNSTFAGNRAEGNGGGIHAGSIRLIHSTITGNTSVSGTGGGVFSEGAVGIENGAFTTINSIIAGNSAPSAPDFSGVIETQLGNNFIGGNPMLAPLGDFGGWTPVCPPLPGSPVMDAAPMLGGTPPSDQLGHPRPLGPLPDIGAVEAFAFSTLPLLDTDGDGIDDRLEPAYQMTVGTDDSHRDMDGDGSPDSEEIANMTDPGNSTNLLRIVSITPAPGFDPVLNPEFDITFTSFPGMSYSVECDHHLDFHGPTSRAAALGIASEFTTTRRIIMDGVSDFARIRREP